MICSLFWYALGLYIAPVDHYWVKVGDTAVIIQQQTNGLGKAFVHLHQNETTALEAAHAVVNAEGECTDLGARRWAQYRVSSEQ